MIITIDTKEIFPILLALLIFPLIMFALVMFYLIVGVLWIIVVANDLIRNGLSLKKI